MQQRFYLKSDETHGHADPLPRISAAGCSQEWMTKGKARRDDDAQQGQQDGRDATSRTALP